MDEKDRQAAFVSALTTEHFVLQTAASGTISEAAGRASLYVFFLSSTVVAIGFTSRSREVFVPFAATVLPILFAVGVFTVIRLVDTALENMHFLSEIARIRGYYRTLTPEAAEYFAPEAGRWPENRGPSLRLGMLFALMSTSASMLALINSLVGGAGVTLLASGLLGKDRKTLAVLIGIATVALLMAAFLAYQSWRFQSDEVAGQKEAPSEDAKRS